MQTRRLFLLLLGGLSIIGSTTEPTLNAAGSAHETDVTFRARSRLKSVETRGKEMPSRARTFNSNQLNNPNIRRTFTNSTLLETKFLEWCKTALGVETILEIQTFEYVDYVQELLNDWDHDEDDDSDSKKASNATYVPTLVPVRGLAASRHISSGETVIRIPLHGLLSITTTIDQDPFLSPIMGPVARKEYGWNLAADDEGFLLELSLLSVALLYHCKLGDESPLAPYIAILQSSPVDSMPFLWNRDELRQASPGIRQVARGIRQDIRDMYQTVLQNVLLTQRPDIFDNDQFSLENFYWAFAMVNSRHWQLPIEDLDQQPLLVEPPALTPTKKQVAGFEDQVPPAAMPTDAWVQEHQELDDDIANESDINVKSDTTMEHSFLAPVADLLNFGPPCTRGRYDPQTHTFEIIASCSFRKGQEVTFWYSDECADVMVGMYGFSKFFSNLLFLMAHRPNLTSASFILQCIP